MDGVVVIDKPQGLTSHDVVATARRALGESRIGHTGTLDPMATGVLPLAVGRATRLVRFLTASDKTYEATIRFGLTTDSYDVTGAETSRSASRPSRTQVIDAVAALTGDYLQTPPAYSAKKVNGRRAYALARQDVAVALTPVPVRVSRADVEAFTGDTAVVTLTCSAGFYVRTFAHSLGERVGCGACLDALRRTRSGEFGVEEAVSLDALLSASPADQAAMVIGLERLLSSWPAVVVGDEGRTCVAHGRALDSRHLAAGALPSAGMPSGGEAWVRVLGRDADLLAMAVWRAGPHGTLLHPSVVLI